MIEAPAAASGPAYDRADAWVCRADTPGDPCRHDLDATELRPDGSHAAVAFTPAVHPGADCFYVYPTVDLGDVPANHTDFSDTTMIRETTRAQVARFSSVCRLFVPLYRQMTIGAYLAPAEEHQRLFDVAFQDVLAAFHYYQAHFDDGRGIVLLGHSQGAQMVEKLVQTVFDDDPAMRARLLVAMPIGGDVNVATGSDRGGTFHNVPLCTSADQPGCVIAYATYSPEGLKHPWPGTPPAGRRTACVNPGGLVRAGSVASTERSHLAGSAFPTRSHFRANMPGSWAPTPFLLLRDFYSAWCVDRPNGFSYLAVTPDPARGDTRASPIDLDGAQWRQQLAGVQLGLHLLDYQFTQDDLIELVRRRAAGPTSPPDPSKPAPAKAVSARPTHPSST
ncbi:MAG TPA: DUF3089 domain-containing protein [Polyangiaceae bacterium]|nr:DUF3089 domain-containing protein [Polyangiaceae bacterium]